MYNGLTQCDSGSQIDCGPRQLTVKERLLSQQATLTARLQEVNEAIQALNDNPEIEKVMTAVGKTLNY